MGDLFADELAAAAPKPAAADNAPPSSIVPLATASAAEGAPTGDDPPWRLLDERRLDPNRPAVGTHRRTTDLRVSLTDPDATPMRTKRGPALGYHDHYVVDGGKRRVILAALVTPADVMENVPMRDLL